MVDKIKAEFDCPICCENFAEPERIVKVFACCGHFYCGSCSDADMMKRCPNCRELSPIKCISTDAKNWSILGMKLLKQNEKYNHWKKMKLSLEKNIARLNSNYIYLSVQFS